MKIRIIKVLFFLLLLPLHAEFKIKTDSSLTNFLETDLLNSHANITCKKSHFGIEADCNLFYLSQLNLQDFLNINFKFDRVELVKTSVAAFYSNKEFIVQPYFSYRNLKSSNGDISIIEGKFNLPYFFQYGMEIDYKNHGFTFSYGNGNATYSPKQLNQTYSKLLDTKQQLYNCGYILNFVTPQYASKTELQYIYISGNFDCEMNDNNGPIFNPFNTFKLNGSDSIQLLVFTQNFNYQKNRFSFMFNFGDYFILKENAPYNISWNGKSDLISKLALKTLKMKNSFSDSSDYNNLTKQGLFTTQLGINFHCYENLILYFSKYFFIPYEFETNSLNSFHIRKNDDLLKWAAAGFNFGIKFGVN